MLSRYWQSGFFRVGKLRRRLIVAPAPHSYSPSMFEAVYLCDSCGEEIVIPVDPAAGAGQSFTEDCPVCCRAQNIRVSIHPDGTVDCQSELE